MKRDFLKELGIADEAINRIMAENGKDIEAAKGEFESLKQAATAQLTELEGYKTQLAQRDADIESLRQSATDSAAVQGATAKKVNTVDLDVTESNVKQIHSEAR